MRKIKMALQRLQNIISESLQDIRHQIICLYHQDDSSVFTLFSSFINLCWKIVEVLRDQSLTIQLAIGSTFIIIWIFLIIKIVQIFLNVFYPSFYKLNSKYEILEDKTVLITGANRGRGFQLAKELASMGARVILACRNLEKAEKAMQQIRESTGSLKLYVVRVDLADMASVRSLAENIIKTESKLDILVCNGSIVLDRLYRTESGLEVQFATNFLGFFLLCNLLLNLLSTSDGRILLPASSDLWKAKLQPKNFNSELKFDQPTTYSNTQLSNIILAKELSRRCHTSKLPVSINCYDPGSSCKSGSWLPAADDKQMSAAVKTMLLLAATKIGKSYTGHLFSNSKIESVPRQAEDKDLAQQLWNFSAFASQLEQQDLDLYS